MNARKIETIGYKNGTQNFRRATLMRKQNKKRKIEELKDKKDADEAILKRE